ncbi:hypothetical protein SeLEV6574_g00563 [Synchytrium endobioticum]|uniref:Aminotransferase class I/classII large domain-containing protein n=1 Tax=Synchytrium endobioticum TaxID=286115 RepID=A0A507DJE8_9FUNG|nr:hypothetical protein SeLEV6574_g00563 [Synchytrium endobioticum]
MLAEQDDFVAMVADLGRLEVTDHREYQHDCVLTCIAGQCTPLRNVVDHVILGSSTSMIDKSMLANSVLVSVGSSRKGSKTKSVIQQIIAKLPFRPIELDHARHFMSQYALHVTSQNSDKQQLLRPVLFASERRHPVHGIKQKIYIGIQMVHFQEKLCLMNHFLTDEGRYAPGEDEDGIPIYQHLDAYADIDVAEASIVAEYDIVSSVVAEGNLAISIDASWHGAQSFLSPPPESSSLTLKVHLVNGEVSDDSCPMSTSLRKEIQVLESWNEVASKGDHDAWSTIGNGEMCISDCVTEFFDHISKNPHTLFQIPQEDAQSPELPTYVLSSIKKRADYDFSEVTWDYCLKAADADDLANVMMSVMDALEDLSLQPIIHKSNHTALAEICRDCLKLSKIQTSLDVVAAKERVSEACDYWSDNVFECMVEVGLYKLKRDLKYWFNHVLVGLDFDTYFDSTVPSSDQIEILKRMNCVVRLWEAVKLNLASLPADSMKDFLVAMFSHFKLVEGDGGVQNTKTRIWPVEFRVEIAPYSGVVKNMFTRRVPNEWLAIKDEEGILFTRSGLFEERESKTKDASGHVSDEENSVDLLEELDDVQFNGSLSYDYRVVKIKKQRIILVGGGSVRMEALSARAQQLVINQSWLGVGMTSVLQNPYSQTNPTGIINLGTAENKICASEMVSKLNSCKPVIERQTLLYGNFKGHDDLRNEIAELYNRHFMPLVRILPDHVIVTNGCTSAISNIAQACTDAGDGILIPSPYYGGFFNDTIYTARCELIPIPATSHNGFEVSVDDIELTYEYATQTMMKRIKAIILCSPNNPLGRTYPKEWLFDVLCWAAERKLHVILDELYALSVWGTTEEQFSPFTSVLQLDLPDPSRTHVLHGIAKDFLSNGFFTSTSNIMQNWMCSMLRDRAWVDNFIKLNQSRLRATYAKLTRWLDEHDVPYLGANAGFFVWIDLRKWLGAGASADASRSTSASAPSKKPLKGGTNSETPSSAPIIGSKRKEREINLFFELLENKIYIAPGEAFYADEEGWYRIVFAVDWTILEEGLNRIAKVLDMRRERSCGRFNVD